MPGSNPAEPTIYPDLNVVLGSFVAGASAVLAESLVGVYLVGSFALGDADEHSDVDFLVVTHSEVGDRQLVKLQALHARIHELDTGWAQHLEGSYVSAVRLRQPDLSHAPLLYLDNGASQLAWDSHCNSAFSRWVLREHGVVLSGPTPKALVDPVPVAQLRQEALVGVREYAEWAPQPTSMGVMSRWKQPYLVLTLCRLLHTVVRGVVSTKRQSGEWALTALAPHWSSLIRAAIDDRPDPWSRADQPAKPEDIDRTLAFVEYVVTEANSAGERRRRR